MARLIDSSKEAFNNFLLRHDIKYYDSAAKTSFSQIEKTIEGGTTVWEVVGEKGGERFSYGVIANGKLWMYTSTTKDDGPFPLAKSKNEMMEDIVRDSIQKFADNAICNGKIDWDELSTLNLSPITYKEKAEWFQNKPGFPSIPYLTGYMASKIEDPSQNPVKVFFMSNGGSSKSVRAWRYSLFDYMSTSIQSKKLARLIYRYQFAENKWDKDAILAAFISKFFEWNNQSIPYLFLTCYHQLLSIRTLYEQTSPECKQRFESIQKAISENPRDLKVEELIFTIRKTKTPIEIYGLEQAQVQMSPIGLYNLSEETPGWIDWTNITSIRTMDKATIWAATKSSKKTH